MPAIIKGSLEMDNLNALMQAVPKNILEEVKALSSDETEQFIMLEEFIERFAIMEIDGLQPRFIAQANALICVKRNFNLRNKSRQ